MKACKMSQFDHFKVSKNFSLSINWLAVYIRKGDCKPNVITGKKKTLRRDLKSGKNRFFFSIK